MFSNLRLTHKAGRGLDKKMDRDYEISIEITDGEGNLVSRGSTYLDLPSTESAEMEFWSVIRGLERDIKKEEMRIPDEEAEEIISSNE